MEMNLLYIAPIGSVAALVFAWVFYKSMMKANPGQRAWMVEIAGGYCAGRRHGLPEAAVHAGRHGVPRPRYHLRRAGLLRGAEPLRAGGVSDRRLLLRPLRLPRHEDRDPASRTAQGASGVPEPRPAGGLPFRRGHGPGGGRLRPAGHRVLVLPWIL